MTLIFFLQSEVFKTYHKKLFNYKYWSHQNTVKNNGKMSSFIFYSNLEQENKKNLHLKNHNINISNTLYKEKIINKKNIYYIVLESFINPNYLKDISFNINPLSTKLKKYLYKGDFSKIISPVYGGNTAQAEFELLTGVKAFSKVNTSEFNVLTGKQIDGFLYQFKKNNYDTVATIASNSGYFNSKSAYKSLGFDKVVFLEEENRFQKNKNDERIFDGDLFSYNLEFLKNNLQKSEKPLFNYVLGVYGHMPYNRNQKDRPDIIQTKNSSISRISNQFYYRTEVLAEYINNIIKLDPNSIILVSSDHLPPILNNKIKYNYSKYTNIALLLENGKPINISKKNQYKIPWVIWDMLSNKQINRKYNKDILEKLYLKALNEGV